MHATLQLNSHQSLPSKLVTRKKQYHRKLKFGRYNRIFFPSATTCSWLTRPCLYFYTGMTTIHLGQSQSAFPNWSKIVLTWVTSVRGLMRGMATLPQGNQELIVVRDKVGRPPGELGVSKSMECDIFHLQCFDTVGWATGRASSL